RKLLIPVRGFGRRGGGNPDEAKVHSIILEGIVSRSLRPLVAVGLIGVLTWAAAGTGSAAVGQQTPAGVTATAAAGDWITYHHDNARTGLAADLAPLGTLSPAWTATLDGAVYGQPLVVGDRVFAATENDTVYALDPATGAVVWSAHVGTPMPRSALPCGNIDPLGITSTMVYDPASDLLFALAERTGAEHVLVSIDATTGQVREQRPAEPPMVTGSRTSNGPRSTSSATGSTSPTADSPATALSTSARWSRCPPPVRRLRSATPCRRLGRVVSGPPAGRPLSVTTCCTRSAMASRRPEPTTAVTRSS